ncbi:MAG: hypothetical protein ACI4XO_07035 [Akkermansia sp.]
MTDEVEKRRALLCRVYLRTAARLASAAVPMVWTPYTPDVANFPRG